MEAVKPAIQTAKTAARSTPKPRRTAVCTISAFLMFCAGLSLPFIGLALIVVHSFIPSDTLLSRAGTVAMILSIPMLLAGSHLIDLIDGPRRHFGD